MSKVVIVHSENVRQRLLELGTDPTKILLMPHGVTRHPEPSPASSTTQARTGRTLLVFGFVDSDKQYDQVFAALSRLPNSYRAVVAGEPRPGDVSYYRKVKETASRMGVSDRVTFTGFVAESEIPALFEAADLVVLPYKHVTQSGVLAQAAGFGKLVLASDIPYFREVKAGFGCIETYSNPSDMVAKASSLLEDGVHAKEMLERLQEYAESADWSSVAERHEEVYHDLEVARQSRRW